MAFRGKTDKIIFKNLGYLNGAGNAIHLLYCLTLIISNSIFGLVLTRIIDSFIWKKDEETIRKTIPFFKRISIRVIFFFSLTIIAYLFPKVT